jgi:hypothetical protein
MDVWKPPNRRIGDMYLNGKFCPGDGGGGEGRVGATPLPSHRLAVTWSLSRPRRAISSAVIFYLDSHVSSMLEGPFCGQGGISKIECRRNLAG